MRFQRGAHCRQVLGIGKRLVPLKVDDGPAVAPLTPYFLATVRSGGVVWAGEHDFATGFGDGIGNGFAVGGHADPVDAGMVLRGSPGVHNHGVTANVCQGFVGQAGGPRAGRYDGRDVHGVKV